eukprot:6084829-Karenia_brevis.AAC.1
MAPYMRGVAVASDEVRPIGLSDCLLKLVTVGLVWQAMPMTSAYLWHVQKGFTKGRDFLENLCVARWHAQIFQRK